MNRQRLTLLLGALLLGLIVVHDLLLILLTAGLFRERSNRDALEYARMNARPVAEAYDRYYHSGYYKFREQAGEVLRLNPDLLRMWLIDVNGTVLFDSREFSDTGGAPVPPEPLRPELASAVREMTLTCRSAAGTGGDAILDVVAPAIEEWGRHRYSVRYHIRHRPWGGGRSGLWLRLALAGALSLLLGAAAAALLAGRLAARGPRPGSGGDAQP